VAQRVGRGIALLFHDRGTRSGWVVSSTPRPHFTPGKDPVPILQEAGWTPGPVWKGGKSCPHRDSIPERPARNQSLYRLSYPVHLIKSILWIYTCFFAWRSLFTSLKYPPDRGRLQEKCVVGNCHQKHVCLWNTTTLFFSMAQQPLEVQGLSLSSLHDQTQIHHFG